MMRSSIGAVLFVCLAVAGLVAQAPKGEGWEPLFDGKTLAGWTRLNGQAPYVVDDGCIVGTTVLDSPNSFLCTDEHFGDFELELEFKVDPRLNSGIQIRSHSLPEYQKGRVHGYQVEIDPSERAWSAGIYDEARRGWLKDLKENEPARRAFKQSEWNHYRIEAIGPRFRTWINGVLAAELVDEMTPSGFIALQVHGIGKDEAKVGAEVRWRNLVIRRLGPTLSDAEARAGWRLLFDGKTPQGWKSARGAAFPEKGWVVKDGVLSCLPADGGESTNGGDIVTEETFGDFELSLEFRFAPGANSGIKYFVVDGLNKGAGSAIGLEYQILDDERHPDAKAGRGGNRTLASLYDLIAAPAEKPVAEPGVWRKARIVSRGKRVEHWLDGMRTVAFERGSEAYRALVAESKYKVYAGFGEAEAGRILLQDHGNAVSFRSIKILAPRKAAESRPTSAPTDRADTDPLRRTAALGSDAWWQASPDPWKEAAKIRFGEAQNWTSTIETQVLTADAAGLKALEPKILALLSDQSATEAARDFAFRMIRLAGTEASVVVVEPFLTDERWSDAARYAVEPIASPKVDEALRAALPKTEGKLRAGIEASLKRRETKGGVR